MYLSTCHIVVGQENLVGIKLHFPLQPNKGLQHHCTVQYKAILLLVKLMSTFRTLQLREHVQVRLHKC